MERRWDVQRHCALTGAGTWQGGQSEGINPDSDFFEASEKTA